MTSLAPLLELWPDQRDRAVRLAKRPDAVRMCGRDRARVASFSTPDLQHTVARAGQAWLCDCDFYLATGLQCGHAVAVRYTLAVEGPTVTSRKVEREEGDERKPFWRQDWSAYNAAQTQEIHLFDELLAGLVSDLPRPTERRRGKQPMPLDHQVFCAVEKAYSQLSSRRAKALYDKAAERGQLERAPHFNVVTKFLNREDATSVLTDLLRRSAEPLADLEADFAVDSTGFRTTTFTPYCQGKHGERKQHAYLKAHAIVGVRTNVVTDLVVTPSQGKGTGDVSNMPSLVRGTAQRFFVHEVSADAAYSARYNHDVVAEAGGEAFIPFKSSATAKKGRSNAWVKAYHLFQAHQDVFKEHYHKRSNVETTFAAIKRKFGDTLKSRNHRAQVNELLCKVIAYNLTVVIQEMHESGIDAHFRPSSTDSTPGISDEAGLGASSS